MNDQCKSCIHRTVCAYKEHYETAVELYERARQECSKYPWFRCKIECVKYYKEVPNPRQVIKDDSTDGIND